MPNDSAQQGLSPEGLASQLFDVAIQQFPANPREAVRKVIQFLTEAIIYSITVATSGNEWARKALLVEVGQSIATAPLPQSKTSP